MHNGKPFKNIPGVVVYLGDILITSKSESEHLATLEVILETIRSWSVSQERNALFGSLNYLLRIQN